MQSNDYLCVERVPQGLGAAKVAYDYFEDLDSFSTPPGLIFES